MIEFRIINAAQKSYFNSAVKRTLQLINKKEHRHYLYLNYQERPMIAFDLQCKNGHVFEGWFKDRSAFEEQREKHLISCPVCDDATIAVVPSTFGIVKSSQTSIPTGNHQYQKDAYPSPEELSRKIVDYVCNNFEDVGCNFAKEALKMHYGVEEPRNIRGVSTKDEEKILEEEGIHVFKLPLPSESDSD